MDSIDAYFGGVECDDEQKDVFFRASREIERQYEEAHDYEGEQEVAALTADMVSGAAMHVLGDLKVGDAFKRVEEAMAELREARHLFTGVMLAARESGKVLENIGVECGGWDRDDVECFFELEPAGWEVEDWDQMDLYNPANTSGEPVSE